MSDGLNVGGGFGANNAKAKDTKQQYGAADLGALFGNGGISRQETAETVNRFNEIFKEVLDKNGIKDMTLVPIDGPGSNLNLSAIALTTKVDNELLMYVMFLEATGPSQLSARRIPLHRQGSFSEVEIPAVTGDLIDTTTLTRVAATIKTTLSFTGTLTNVGAHVIATELNIHADNFAADARQHLRSAVNALMTERSIIQASDKVFSLPQWASNIFACRTEHSVTHTLDNNNLPVREDLSISLTVVDPQVGNKSQAIAASNELGRSAGYPELRFTGIQPGVMVMNPGTGFPMPSMAQFQPRFVITNTQLETRGFNYQLQLLTLAMTTLFNRNKAWMAAYRPSYLSGGTSSKLRDLAALSHELQVEVNTKEVDTQVILSQYCHDSMQYVIHIPENGESTWFQTLLRDVAAGVPEARQGFIQHADALTGDRFSKHLDPKDPIAIMEADRVILGYYIDAEGEKRDLREIDYLAMLNLVGATDMTLVEKYDHTFNPNTGSIEERLASRVQCLAHILRDNMHIKGYATPVILTGSALEALWTSIEKCGIKPRTSGDMEYRTQTRGYSGTMDWAMAGGVMSSFGNNYQTHTSQFQPNWTAMQRNY